MTSQDQISASPDQFPAGDHNIGMEIEGLKTLIKSGDTSPTTLLRLAVLVENLLDRVGRLEAQRNTPRAAVLVEQP